MVCSKCATVIATAEEGTTFDVFDCAWLCPGCEMLWLSSDGWAEVGRLVVPYREEGKANG
jgi:hypothetical protein